MSVVKEKQNALAFLNEAEGYERAEATNELCKRQPRMDGRAYGRTDRRTDGRTDERTDSPTFRTNWSHEILGEPKKDSGIFAEKRRRTARVNDKRETSRG